MGSWTKLFLSEVICKAQNATPTYIVDFVGAQLTGHHLWFDQEMNTSSRTNILKLLSTILRH